MKNDGEPAAAAIRKKERRFFLRLWRALTNSLAGLAAAVRDEAAFRQELVIAAVLLPLAFIAADSGGGRALLVFSVLLVLAAELANTAIEAAADLACGGAQNKLARKAKDAASAFVLVTIAAAAAVWALVLLA
jgi:diacylglycerol kinase (ATP)